jgi:NTP pyrophosphatase (non-canonical NTP hydrolase)
MYEQELVKEVLLEEGKTVEEYPKLPSYQTSVEYVTIIKDSLGEILRESRSHNLDGMATALSNALFQLLSLASIVGIDMEPLIYDLYVEKLSEYRKDECEFVYCSDIPSLIDEQISKRPVDAIIERFFGLVVSRYREAIICNVCDSLSKEERNKLAEKLGDAQYFEYILPLDEMKNAKSDKIEGNFVIRFTEMPEKNTGK